MPQLGLGVLLLISRLKTLPPNTTGTPGVGFWRGGCPKRKPHMDQEKKGCEVLGQTDLKFQSLIYSVVNISDR